MQRVAHFPQIVVKSLHACKLQGGTLPLSFSSELCQAHCSPGAPRILGKCNNALSDWIDMTAGGPCRHAPRSQCALPYPDQTCAPCHIYPQTSLVPPLKMWFSAVVLQKTGLEERLGDSQRRSEGAPRLTDCRSL
jgi:hypothetical protein